MRLSLTAFDVMIDENEYPAMLRVEVMCINIMTTISRVNVTPGRIQNTVKDLRWSFLQK